MNNLIRDTLSQIRRVAIEDGHVIIYLNHHKTDKQKIVDSILFHFIDNNGNKFGDSSIVFSKMYSTSELKTITFLPDEDIDLSRASKIFLYVLIDEVRGIEFPLEKTD